MNMEKFKRQQELFLLHYPGGSEHPVMKQLTKKHHIEKFMKLCEDQLRLEDFENPEAVFQVIVKIVTGSTLVSVFEKTAFKKMANAYSDLEKATLVNHYKNLLHGNQQEGFEAIVEMLGRYGNAKWPIITCVLYYSNPYGELVVKPTTAKQAIAYFEADDLFYVTKPDYSFYTAYRDWVIALRDQAEPELMTDNGAFCGFLMFAVAHQE